MSQSKVFQGLGLAAVLASSACGADAAPTSGAGPLTEAPPPPPGSTPRPGGPPAPTAPMRCTGKAGKAGDSELRVPSSGLSRAANVFVPPSYDPTKPAAVVLVLHPLLLTRREMRAIARVDGPAKAAGFLAVYPDGVDRSWNAGECCGTAKDQKVDDVKFVTDLMATLRDTYCIDDARIFAMGFSNGAFLAHRLACEAPGMLRAITTVAGTLGVPEASCKATAAMPVLAMHGTADELVPYEGGSPQIPRGETFGTFVGPGVTDAFWARRSGCNVEPVVAYQKGEVTCRTHEGCRDAAIVTLCTVDGGGHQWPSGPVLPAMGHRTTDIDATAAAIAFFGRYGL